MIMSTIQPRSLRIALIGAGANTRLRHAPGFQKIPGVECTVVCNRSVESSRKFASEFGIQKTATDWRQVVADPDVDAVCIGTWPYLHADITCAALENGKHVLTEARMAANLQEAERMWETASRHPELVAQIVAAPMSLPIDSLAQEYIAAGKLGRIREVIAQHTTALLALESTPMGWRSDYQYSGKNVLTLGIIQEMINRWIAEDPVHIHARAVFATDRRTHFESGILETVRIPDSITVCADYPSGGFLLHHISALSSGTPRGEIRLNGSKGTLRFDLPTSRLYYAEVGSSLETELKADPSVGDGWRVEEEFVASIREGKPVLRTDFQSGLRYMRFTEEVFTAWNQASR